jgi:hypothetical protein
LFTIGGRLHRSASAASGEEGSGDATPAQLTLTERKKRAQEKAMKAMRKQQVAFKKHLASSGSLFPPHSAAPHRRGPQEWTWTTRRRLTPRRLKMIGPRSCSSPQVSVRDAVRRARSLSCDVPRARLPRSEQRGLCDLPPGAVRRSLLHRLRSALLCRRECVAGIRRLVAIYCAERPRLPGVRLAAECLLMG